MINLLAVVPNPSDGTSFYRATGPLNNLRKQIRTRVLDGTKAEDRVFDSRVLGAHDVIFIQRPFTETHAKMIDYAHNCNRKVWIDYDDDLLNVPSANPNHDAYMSEASKYFIKSCLSQADLVTVSTKNLKKSYEQFNKNVHIIPNAFNDDLFKLEYAPTDREKKVVWRGTATHRMDLFEHKDTIIDLCKMTDYTHKWFFYGCFRNEIDFLSEFTGKNVSYITPMDIVYYMHHMKKTSPTLGFIPLQYNEFNLAKSNIGYIEMIYAGAIPIVPYWDEWKDLPGSFSYAHGFDTDTQTYYSDFEDVFRGLLSIDYDPTQVNKEGVDYIRENLMLSKINQTRLELIWSMR